jgi:hypothetical protein
VKLAIGAFAGLAAAWFLPKGGPAPVATPTPTPPGQLTAAEVPLSTVPAGVSFRTIDGVRVFLVRTGDSVVGFHGQATTRGTAEPVYWCPRTSLFEGANGPWYHANGKVYELTAPRELDRIQVLVAAGRVTIFPHNVMIGAPPPTPTVMKGPPPPEPCPANERVG